MASVNTRISPTGTISRRVASKKMVHLTNIARMLREAFDDVTDGDDDNRRAAKILMCLEEINLYQYHIEAHQFDGDLAGAEDAADRYLLKD